MELDYKAIGKRIKIARIKADLTQERLAELPPCAATAVPAAAAAAAAAAALVVFLHSHAMGAPEGGDGLRACMRSNDFEVRLLLLYIFTSPDSVSF